jgi:hypothetical protein
MLMDAGGDVREVGEHGAVVEPCSCMELVHVGTVVLSHPWMCHGLP